RVDLGAFSYFAGPIAEQGRAAAAGAVVAAFNSSSPASARNAVVRARNNRASPDPEDRGCGRDRTPRSRFPDRGPRRRECASAAASPKAAAESLAAVLLAV